MSIQIRPLVRVFDVLRDHAARHIGLEPDHEGLVENEVFAAQEKECDELHTLLADMQIIAASTGPIEDKRFSQEDVEALRILWNASPHL